jgi:hypothetical protein
VPFLMWSGGWSSASPADRARSSTASAKCRGAAADCARSDGSPDGGAEDRGFDGPAHDVRTAAVCTAV